MATAQCFSLVRGRVMRVTALDGCGAPITPGAGICTSVVSEGFVSIAFTANTDEGEEISVTNAAGKVCVRDTPCPSFLGYTAEIAFCEVDPNLLALVTGQQPMYDEATSEAIGFTVNSGISGCDSGFALEIWSNVPGVACEPGGGEGTFGYTLLPFLQGGVFGDFTIENAAVTFTVSGASTKTGSGWGTGPYDIRTGTGPTAKLPKAVDKDDHLAIIKVNKAPPDPGCGCVLPLATGATAGTPGTWTPANTGGPYDLADLRGATPPITASPTAAWTAGQSVELGDGSDAHWDGNSWESGTA